jgi:hypothetical protein
MAVPWAKLVGTPYRETGSYFVRTVCYLPERYASCMEGNVRLGS